VKGIGRYGVDRDSSFLDHPRRSNFWAIRKIRKFFTEGGTPLSEKNNSPTNNLYDKLYITRLNNGPANGGGST